MKFKKEDYEHMIKDYCVGCGEKMKKEWKRYKNYGNFCYKCSTKAQRNVDAKKKYTYEELFKIFKIT